MEDQEHDELVRISNRMYEIEIDKIRPASRCLVQGFHGRLFERRMAEDLVVCASSPDDLDLPAQEETKFPSPSDSSRQSSLLRICKNMKLLWSYPVHANVIPKDLPVHT